MSEDKLKMNTELADELISPMLKVIDNYFFITFEDCEGNKGLMLPLEDKLKNLEEVAENMRTRAQRIDGMACIISAYGKDSLREGQKAGEMSKIASAILELAKVRIEQVKSALNYEKNKKCGNDFF